MICGDVTVVSWVMVLVRRNYFQKKCAHVIRQRRHTGRLRAGFEMVRSLTLGTPNISGVPTDGKPDVAEIPSKPVQEKKDSAPEVDGMFLSSIIPGSIILIIHLSDGSNP
jgi:hypothetical protein